HTITCAEGDERYEIKLDQIVHNPQIDRAAFEFPKTSSEALPDIPELLKEVGKNEDEIDRLLEKYTYTEMVTKRELEPNSQMKVKESETLELTFHKGARIRRLSAKNGASLWRRRKRPTRRKTSRSASARSKRERLKRNGKSARLSRKRLKTPTPIQTAVTMAIRPMATLRMNAKSAPRSPTCCERRGSSIRAANASARAT